MSSSVMIVAYLALFASVGVVFLFVNLLVGSFLRPAAPNPEKLEIYECGEPAIGSSFIQFDLRFYVVALLFIIFDVEIAFFFPWATVFGKSTHLMDRNLEVVQATEDGSFLLTEHAEGLYREMGVKHPQGGMSAEVIKNSARKLVWISMADIGVFFAVLLVGFAYVWKRGDLDWVRAVGRTRDGPVQRVSAGSAGEQQRVLSA